MHPSHGTPARAVVVSGVIVLAGLVVWAPFTGPATYYGCAGTIGTLALILVYLGVTAGQARSAMARAARVAPRSACWARCCCSGRSATA